MNVYKPTGKKVSSWPQMVVRLTEEKEGLVREIEELRKEVEDLKRRCCDLWREVMEAQAKNDS